MKLDRNKTLALAVVVLAALSVLSYQASVRRAERFERGQPFLPHLNPDEIQEIILLQGEETLQLRRAEDRFVVVGAEGYPATNESVNRLLRRAGEISLEQEVGRSEALREELELEPPTEETVEVAFKDRTGGDLVRFRVGASLEEAGSYVQRIDGEEPGPIYLTESRIFLDIRADQYLDKQIVAVEQADIEAIRGPDFTVERDEDGGLALAELPAGKKESSRLQQLKTALSSLRFVQHHLADAEAVEGLTWSEPVHFDLGDQSGYRVSLASRDEEHYLRIQGYHRAGQLTLARDAEEEEVRETADILARADEIQEFNRFHGSWIYEISDAVARRFQVSRSDLMEDV